MKIIVGLGNPGFRYRNTRHNVGFMVLNKIAKKYKVPIKKKGYKAFYNIGNIEGQTVALFEPMTYMNLSGEAVASVCASKLDNKEDLIVVTDDVNIPLGTLRLREKGSSGGHNGLKSIIDNLDENFVRLRVGVGPEYTVQDMSSYVLGGFSRKERLLLSESIEKASECVITWLRSGTKEAMNIYN